jgi:hypothetical protein
MGKAYYDSSLWEIYDLPKRVQVTIKDMYILFHLAVEKLIC